MPKNRIIPALGVSLLVPVLALAQAPAPKTTPDLAPGTPSLFTPGAPLGGLPGAAPAPAKAEPATDAEKALDDAIKKVAALKSVAADFTQAVDLLGQHFELRGRYLKAPDYRIYLKLSVFGLGDTSGDMLQICDGSTLWDFQQILKTDRAYTRLDVAKILRKVDSPEFNADLRKQALQRIGFTGPESLLVGLRNALRFYHKDADTVDGKAVWVLRGEWKDLASLIGPMQQPMRPDAPLPPYIPSLAQVWIGQEDGWPYRVWLEGRQPSILEDVREVGYDGKKLGAKGNAKRVEVSKVLLNYTNVKLNSELDKNTFAFTAPADAPVMDGTDQFLISLEQASAAMQAEKRSAAAKESEPPKLAPGQGLAPEIPSTVPKSLEKGSTPNP